MSYKVGEKVKVSQTSFSGKVEKSGLDGEVVGHIIKLDTPLRGNDHTAYFYYIVTENLTRKGKEGASTTGQIESKVSGGKRKSRKVKRTKKYRSTRRQH